MARVLCALEQICADEPGLSSKTENVGIDTACKGQDWVSKLRCHHVPVDPARRPSRSNACSALALENRNVAHDEAFGRRVEDDVRLVETTLWPRSIWFITNFHQ